MPGTPTSFSYSILGQGKIILVIACLSWHLSNEIATATEYTVYCASKSSVINRCAAMHLDGCSRSIGLSPASQQRGI
jgi:hypothetical protein